MAALGFAPIGTSVLAFLALAAGLLPGSRRAQAGIVSVSAVGAAYVASAVFPCDAGCPSEGSLSQAIHNTFGLLEYVGAVFGLLLLANAWGASARWRSFAPLCTAAAALVAAGFVAMLVPALAPFRGLSQRVAETAIFLWIALLSVRLLRLPEPATPSTRPSVRR